MKPNGIILVFFILTYTIGSSQQLELGLGTTTPNLGFYGWNIHAFTGIKLSKGFTMGIKLDYHILPRKNEFYDMYIDYGLWDSPFLDPDTNYNVKQTNYYNIYSAFLEPRFYSKKDRKYQTYITPSIGFGLFKERVVYTNETYNKENVYYNFKPSIGYEKGYEFAITSDKKTSLQIAFNAKVYFGFRVTDVYNSSFGNGTNLLLNGRLALVRGGR